VQLHAIQIASRRQWGATELKRFDLGTSDVDGYEGEDRNVADKDEDEEASHVDDGSTQNIEDWGHSRVDLETSDVDGYDGEDGDPSSADQAEDASQEDDESTEHMEHWGHGTRNCKD